MRQMQLQTPRMNPLFTPVAPLFITIQNNVYDFVCGETSCSGQYNLNGALDKKQNQITVFVVLYRLEQQPQQQQQKHS